MRLGNGTVSAILITVEIKNNIFSSKIYIYIVLRTLLLHFRSKNKTSITPGDKITFNSFDQIKLLGESHKTSRSRLGRTSP